MPRRRRNLRVPSYRNLQIYHELAYKRRTQTALAPEFGLGQVRISQIARQVQAWADNLVPPRQFPGQPGQRFHLAIARERLRLHKAYDPLLGMFVGPDLQPRFVRQYVAVVNGEPLSTLEVSDKPDFHLMNQAVDVQGRLAELEAIANLGPFADLPHEFDQTIVHTYGRPDDTPANPYKTTSNPASNASNCPSNPTENRGRGVLEPRPETPSPETLTPSPTKTYAQPVLSAVQPTRHAEMLLEAPG